MTKSAAGDKLLTALEEAVLRALDETSGKERNDAIANGIKLAAIKHRIRGGSDELDYFSGS